MKKYLIDGNNLICKIQSLSKLQKKDKQASREKLAFFIDRYFSHKKVEVFLHFDGFANQKIITNKTKIVYSDSRSADEKIKKQIELEPNRKNLVVISSDINIRDYAKVCGCEVIISEEFGKMLCSSETKTDEKEEIISGKDVDFFKKVFLGKNKNDL